MPILGDLQLRQSARRPKPQVACTICKSKKLRCDRKLPCSSCRRRPPGSCIYVSKTQNTLPRESMTGIHDGSNHINGYPKHSEHVNTFIAETLNNSLAETADQLNVNDKRHRPLSRSENQNHVQRSLNSSLELDSHDSETRLISSTSWESVLHDISTIKSKVNVAQYFEDGFFSAGGLHSRPALLFDNIKDASIEHFVNLLPAKPVIDQLVNLFTLGVDIPPLPIHLPTFLRDYKTFWEHPDKVTLPWLSILYSVITLALQFVLKSGTKIQGIPFTKTACRHYASKAADCLKCSDYSKLTSNTVEATIMNLISEHIWLGEYPFRASLILGFAIRLAMRSGYHRDPSHYRQVSIFEGEMRRRVWSYLVQVDILFSSYLGLPRQISNHQTDTASPTNMADEDLYPEMTHLSPCYSHDEPSATGFLNFRAQVASLLGQITDYVTSFHELSYERILKLDRSIDEQANIRPAWLTPLTAPKAPVDMNRAIEIDVLLQRARIILHQKFLTYARIDPKYVSSRERCVMAAIQILRHQQTLSHVSFEMDGMIVDNWRALSFMSQNFLLAAMIICFDLAQQRHNGLFHNVEIFQERLMLLKSCQTIFAKGENLNPGIQKAIRAIEVVISHVERPKTSDGDGDELEHTSRRENWLPFGQAQSNGILGTSHARTIDNSSSLFGDVPLNSFDEGYGILQPSQDLQDMVGDFSTDLDWNSWILGDGMNPW